MPTAQSAYLFGGVIFWLGLMFVYFTPTIAAFYVDRKRKYWIAGINLFAGWTGIGWFIAYLWSLLGE